MKNEQKLIKDLEVKTRTQKKKRNIRKRKIEEEGEYKNKYLKEKSMIVLSQIAKNASTPDSCGEDKNKKKK